MISIIVCTRNRAESLRATLASLACLSFASAGAAELVVVNNASTDHTAAVLEQAAPFPVPLLHLHEPRPGKSHAYNAALAHARGDVFLSTDDDVRVPADWLTRMCEPILAGRVGLVQGGIAPASHLARPWLRNSFLAVSATVEIPSPAAVPGQCIGANMAFSRAVLEIVRGFDPLLGPGSPGGLCEDTLFGEMARAAGFTACYADCTVEHHFDVSRLEPASVIEVARRSGRSRALIDYHWHHDESKASRLRGALVAAKLRARSALRPKRLDPLPEWLFCYERELAYQRQMAELAGSPRRYRRHAVTALLSA